ncbi:hypothetical protein M6B38_326260 [Iris pallida]|uniref:Uncharacterized protein n=1 Tax=Iris pallida TaxID=29817 RepID=A0AAX6H6H6_IRIPA|nr:hypothetical protein M6B38_326260 [Iris pallida]
MLCAHSSRRRPERGRADRWRKRLSSAHRSRCRMRPRGCPPVWYAGVLAVEEGSGVPEKSGRRRRGSGMMVPRRHWKWRSSCAVAGLDGRNNGNGKVQSGLASARGSAGKRDCPGGCGCGFGSAT